MALSLRLCGLFHLGFLCRFPSAHIICLPTLFTFVYAAQRLTQTLPSCIHKSLLVHCTTCHGRLSHHLVNGKLFQKEDMFAHKHGPRAPVFTVVMAALGYSTNRPSMFLSHLQKRMFVLEGSAITVQLLTFSAVLFLHSALGIQFSFFDMVNDYIIGSFQRLSHIVDFFLGEWTRYHLVK